MVYTYHLHAFQSLMPKVGGDQIPKQLPGQSGQRPEIGTGNDHLATKDGSRKKKKDPTNSAEKKSKTGKDGL